MVGYNGEVALWKDQQAGPELRICAHIKANAIVQNSFNHFYDQTNEGRMCEILLRLVYSSQNGGFVLVSLKNHQEGSTPKKVTPREKIHTLTLQSNLVS